MCQGPVVGAPRAFPRLGSIHVREHSEERGKWHEMVLEEEDLWSGMRGFKDRMT